MAGEGGYVVRTGRAAWLGTGDEEVLPADPQRIAALFWLDTTLVEIVVSTSGLGPQDAHFRLASSGYPEFTFSRHGPLPACRWTFTGSVAGDSFTWTEVLVASHRAPPGE